MLMRYAVYIIILSIFIFVPFLVDKNQNNNKIIKRNSINVKLIKEEIPKKTKKKQIKKSKK